ncbi:MAG: hypothetical protein ATN32_01525 [Candidatus Epulonipiscium fishelsonii]|nr:MAG: hypothetical protein ATN32_01525 [Epulopiscium sp. AS2M-Bin002]
MKPIKLKIQGVNSFVDEQVIDFEKLTDRGFFGIFGATGSGKSSILDSITLALYGSVARESRGFINSHCESANVSFTFSISDNIYKVQREFKLNKEKGINSGKCILVDVRNNEVLADKVTSVNQECKNLIGLEIEDFTRTVILPQGKFSEFLKLKNLERSQMLERLFNLEQYGDKLSDKLKNKMQIEEKDFNTLQGQLITFKDVNSDALTKLNESYTLINEVMKEHETELENLNNLYIEYENLLSNQNQLNELEKIYEELENKKEEILQKEDKIKIAKIVEILTPFIKEYNVAKKEVEAITQELSQEKIIFDEFSLKKEKICSEWETLNVKKQKEIPNLEKEKIYLEKTLEQQKEIEDIQVVLNKLYEDEKIYLKAKAEQEELFHKKQQEVDSINSEINTIQQEIVGLHFDPDLKKDLKDIINIKNRYDIENETFQETEKEIADLKDKLALHTQEYRTFQEKVTLLKKQLDAKSKEHQELIKNPIGTQEDLLLKKEKVTSVNDRWNKHKYLIEQIEQKGIDILADEEILKKEQETYQAGATLIEELRQDYRKLEMENITYKLRQNLVVGEKCPVCMSIYQEPLTFEYDEGLILKEKRVTKVKDDIDTLDKKLKSINREVISKEEKIKQAKANRQNLIKELAELGDEFKTYTPEVAMQEFEELKQNFNSYNFRKDKLQAELNDIEKLYDNISINMKNKNDIIKENELVILKKTQANNQLKNNIDELQNTLNIIKETFKTDKFQEKLDDIEKIEKRRNAFQEKQMELLRNSKLLLEECSKSEKLVQEEKDKLNKISGQIEEKSKDIESRQKIMVQKIDTNQLQQITNQINQINIQWENLDSQKQMVEKEYINYNNKHLEIEVRAKELSSNYTKKTQTLEDLLAKYNYSSIDDVRKDYIKPEDIEQFEKTVKTYYEEATQNKHDIDKLIELIGSKFVTEEEFNKTKESKHEIEDKLKKSTAESIKIKEQIVVMTKQLDDMKEISAKSETLEHKLSLLKELQSVLQGKKFVKFVSIERLKYVANEASKRLLDITNGNFGLESDNEGNFIIRDYKNGGVVRETATLSGGETFLVSLSLALSLSSEIQLKGTSPLELFFLDEGFGTLDEELLEVVMTSLERLHHDKLKVGIITHVESIKNRVPVKLLVSASKLGEGGSKVKIERS